MSGSYAGRMAPPGMPKMVSTPAFSSDADQALGARHPLGTGALLLGHLGPVRSICGVSANKKPLGRRAARGGRVGADRAVSAHASREYEDAGGAHGPTVAAGSHRRQPSLPGVPASGTPVPHPGSLAGMTFSAAARSEIDRAIRHVARGHPARVVAGEPDAHRRVGQREVGVVVLGLGQLADGVHEPQPGREVAGVERRGRGCRRRPRRTSSRPAAPRPPGRLGSALPCLFMTGQGSTAWPMSPGL